MNTEQMIAIITARQSLFAAAEHDELNGTEMQALAYRLLELERNYPESQADAFQALAGPREDWEIA